jgi:hypothetical protein
MRTPALLLTLALAACAMPSTTVRNPETRPSLAVVGAPDGSLLFVDGKQIGDPNEWDGEPNVLYVEPGTHLVEVRARDGVVLLERKVYVESELKTLEVN